MPHEATVRQRVEELTWALVDEQITDDEFRLLENLLLSDDSARETYLDCMQMQADLVSHYRGAAKATHGHTPVLGLLGGAGQAADPQPSQH